MRFDIITIFPNIFNSYFNESIIKRAQNKKIIKIKIHGLRKWTKDKHKTVDGRPYGGGAGMVLMAEPIYQALKSLRQKRKAKNSKIILLSAKGKKWDQQMAKRYAKFNNIILICGRYEGVDERVKKIVDEEISIGDYVLTGGEIPAMVIVDSIARLLPGVLGNKESAKFESHSEAGVLEYPHYTRPEILKINGKNYKVPKALLSGNHAEIKKWREKKSKKLF
ncbi:tRNA (guanosine(37)-N1)-methyltransferase TrmD [Candidatus Falkowbacteria bacterium CG10_big_fil_rev_8_21_14_0_10_43_10]|uniref:tRNA (guanine-N(1)-)-methyltransferase n=1 Tax=Candidatus Falkowbacteria bacterium CG10_big_fil_rev_8_21_14_0_10_43_10 TaxID=1974567 RepID=A0A2H0V213_9BACT|nr:MAG: tRNA (guanosine(37)-N1)-methyltransferase TrmD [Candidatus Falkowbacteria bacterium CG10_big_fil_rev_8_21_14_0_10_43_10]